MTHFILRLVNFILYVNFSVEGGNKISYIPQHNQSLEKVLIENLPLEDSSYVDPSIDRPSTRYQESPKSRQSEPGTGENVSYSVSDSLILGENVFFTSAVRKESPLSIEDENPGSEKDKSSNPSLNHPILNNRDSQPSKPGSKKTKQFNSNQEDSIAQEEIPLKSPMNTTNLGIDLAKSPSQDSDPGDHKVSASSRRNFTLEENSAISHKGYLEAQRISNSTENTLIRGVLPGNAELENMKGMTLSQSESLTKDNYSSSTMLSDSFAVKKDSMSASLTNPILQVLKSPTDLENHSPKKGILESSLNLARAEGISQARLPKVFFLVSTTTTKTTLTTVTRTVINTCYSTHMSTTAPSDFNLGPCNGKKRRKRFLQTFPTDAEHSENETEFSLDSTLSDSVEENEDTGNRQGRVLTFWSTSRTTITVTTKSFLTGTTATVTVQCTLANVITSPFCGFIHFD